MNGAVERGATMNGPVERGSIRIPSYSLPNLSIHPVHQLGQASQARLNDVVLFHLHSLAHRAKGALNLIGGELRVALRLEGVQEPRCDHGRMR